MTLMSYLRATTSALIAFLVYSLTLTSGCTGSTAEDWHVVTGMRMSTDDMERLSPQLGDFLKEVYETESFVPLRFANAGHKPIGTLRLRGEKINEELILRNVVVEILFYERRVRDIQVFRFEPSEREPSFRELLGIFSRAGFTGKNGETVENAVIQGFNNGIRFPDGSPRFPDQRVALFAIELYRSDAIMTVEFSTTKLVDSVDFSIHASELFKIVFTGTNNKADGPSSALVDYRNGLARRQAQDNALKPTEPGQ